MSRSPDGPASRRTQPFRGRPGLTGSMSRNDFDRFVADSTDGLLRTAYLIVGDLQEAEDLVQETLFKVARRWPKVSRMDHPAAYARRILVNLALRGSPKRSRRRAELSEARSGEPDRPGPVRPPRRAPRRTRRAPAAPARGARPALLPGPSRSRGCGRTPVLPRHRQEHGFSWTRATRADAAPDQRHKEHRIMTQLETDLRAALHERAARIHASPDLLAADYHPRTRRLRPSVAIGGGLATVAGRARRRAVARRRREQRVRGLDAPADHADLGAARSRRGLLRQERADPGAAAEADRRARTVHVPRVLRRHARTTSAPWVRRSPTRRGGAPRPR